MPDKIKILIVDDSPISRGFLAFILESNPELKVVGFAEDGDEALEQVVNLKPDVITMDLVMPKMDGFEVTKKIMQIRPTPIIIVSAAYKPQQIDQGFRALDAGALAILEKPKGIGDPEHEEMCRVLIETIKATSKIKIDYSLQEKVSEPITKSTGEVVIPPPAISYTTSQYGIVKENEEPKPQLSQPSSAIPDGSFHQKELEEEEHHTNIKAVAIGGNIGGPQALHTILSKLPSNFSAPIFVVQRMSKGFFQGLVDWLDKASPLKVRLARHGEHAYPGYVYIAPDKFHMEIGKGNIISLVSGDKEEQFTPSIGRLFRSMASVYGSSGVGVILTGMAREGIEELNMMRKAGALTIAQDEASCVMSSMPREAVQLGAVKKVVALDKIADTLEDLINKKIYE